MDQPLARTNADLTNGGFEIPSHLLERSAHRNRALRVVLEITKHLCKILGPFLKLRGVISRNAQHLSRYNVRKWLREVSNYVKMLSVLHCPVDQIRNDVTDVRTEYLHTAGRKCIGSQSPDPGMGGRVKEKHLLHHHASDGR